MAGDFESVMHNYRFFTDLARVKKSNNFDTVRDKIKII